MKPSRKIGIALLVGVIVIAGLVTTLVVGRSSSEDADSHAAMQTSAPGQAAPRTGLAAADKDGDGIVYQSGMHPWIVEDAPGQCPICGMDLVPVNVGEVEEGVVHIDAATIQNTGVRTADIQVASLQRIVRTTGRFEPDQQRAVAVSPKVSGWIERLHVNYEGARVQRGQPLFDIYSPELVSTQEEYLLALRNAERLGNTDDARRLVDAARRRLTFWDISDQQIRRLEATGTPQKTLTLYAPANGTVSSTAVTEGQKIMAGQTLMSLSDLSQLWLMVDVYEQDLSWVGLGTNAQISLPYDAETKFVGRIDYIYDALDQATRTVKARVRVPNGGLKLKPGMYATVQLTGGATAALPVVPSEAVVRTGDRTVVILALGGGRFMPAEVETGVESEGRVQITRGVLGNERVVTSAQFLIDSEARLASAVGSMMAGHDHGSAPMLEAEPARRERPDARAAAGAAPPADHRPGPANAAGASSPAEQQHVRVTIQSSGFQPSQIHLKEGVETRLTFVRETEQTCATEVQIPALGIAARELPMNEPVTLTLTPPRDGTYSFACAMDMVKGLLIVAAS